MQSGIDTLASHANWSRLYELLPEDRKSPFFSPEYYLAYKEVDKDPAYCFWGYKDQDNFLFYPFLKKSINALGYDLEEDFYDVSGAYGYNGPIGLAADGQFLKYFNSRLERYLIDKNIVTEFVRYCPIDGNHSFHEYADKHNVLDNVFIDLSRGLEWVWNDSIKGKVRTDVRKGKQHGLRTAILRTPEISGRDLDCFYGIYQDTMRSIKAADFYYFNYNFFLSIILNMKDMAAMAITYLNNVAISAELVLLSKNLAFSFLLGTLREYYGYKANTFQHWQIVKYLFDEGVQVYSLGGGNTTNDNLYAYKKGFAKNCDNPFYIGTKVHYPDVYKQIQAQWRERFPQAAAMHANKIQGHRFQS